MSSSTSHHTNKKLKLEACCPSPLDDWWNVVLPLLSPTELLSISLTSKDFYHAIKYETVLHSVLLAGETQRGLSSCAAVVHLIKKKRIFIPSPIRLLMLCTTKVCEFCSDKTNWQARPEYAIMICGDCLKYSDYKRTMQLNSKAATTKKRYGFILSHQQATGWYGATSRYGGSGVRSNKPYFWLKDYSSAGSRTGPLITIETADRIRADANSNQEKMIKKLDEYLKENFDDSVGDRICSIYDKILPEAEKRMKAQSEDKIEKKKIRVKSKEQKLDQMRNQVLDPFKGKYFHDIIVHTTLFKEILAGDLMMAPSKITKKRITTLKQQLQHAFEPLDKFDSFTSCYITSDTPLGNALKTMVTQLTFTNFIKNADKDFWEALEAGTADAAVLSQMKSEIHRKQIFMHLMQQKYANPLAALDAEALFQSNAAKTSPLYWQFRTDSPQMQLQRLQEELDKLSLLYDRAMLNANRFLSLEWITDPSRKRACDRARVEQLLFRSGWREDNKGRVEETVIQTLLSEPVKQQFLFDFIHTQNGVVPP